MVLKDDCVFLQFALILYLYASSTTQDEDDGHKQQHRKRKKSHNYPVADCLKDGSYMHQFN